MTLDGFDFAGDVYPVNRDGSDILGNPTYTDVADVPDGKADLVFVCTPPAANSRPTVSPSRADCRDSMIT